MSEISDIFNKQDEMFLVFTKKKVNFFLFFCPGEHAENKQHQNNLFASHFSLVLLGSLCLMGILLRVNIACT